MKKILLKWWPLLLILLASLFFRFYMGQEWFSYSHDHDLLGWSVKDVLNNKHPRLVGQITSTQGIFIGPLWYYFQIPFYLLAKMDPIGGVWGVTLLGVLSTLSFWFVFTQVFGKKEGYIAAVIHAFSYYLIFNDREVVPTMPVVLWTVWFLFTIHLLIKGHKRGLILLGLLVGLIWHLNLALILALPAAVLAAAMSKKKLSRDGLLKGAGLALVFCLPLIFFELRHNFPQARALYLAFTTPQQDILSGIDKFQRVILLLGKNVKTFVFGPKLDVSYSLSLFASLLAFIYLSYKKKISKKLFWVFCLWGATFLGFFSIYSKILSEYYLNGILIIWICILVVGISSLFTGNYRKLGALVLGIYLVVNVVAFFNHPNNRSGYLERKELVGAIDSHRLRQGYACISISYITDPGYNLGYRYFFWLRNMKVNHPKSGAPVYTIVFPLKDIFSTQENFGAIGLIYPDHSRYTKEEVQESCSGENSNLTDPMFNFTQ